MTCAYAVRGALKKFPGVESVDVGLNKGLATVKLKPGNTVRPQDLWEAVRRNGFTPKETRVVVRGTVSTSPQLQLKVTGTSEVLSLTGEASTLQEAAKQNGNTVIAAGSLVPGKDVKVAVPLDVRSIKLDQ